MEENENIEIESLEPASEGEYNENISEETIQSPEGETEEISSEEDAAEEIKTKPDDEIRRRKQKIDQLKRDKYRALNRIKELEQKVNQLESFSSQSNQAAMIHYDTTVQLRLEKARQKLTQALETGDIPSQIEANEEIAEVKADEKYLKSWKAQQEYRSPTASKQTPSYSSSEDHYEDQGEELNEDAQQWVAHNSWFNENSSDYDPEMADEVRNYMHALNRRLVRTGQQDKYSTPQYFNEIDNYIRKNFDDIDAPQRKEIIMKAVPKAVAPVGRATGPTRRPGKIEVKLTEDEKFMAKNMGVKEEDWIRHKMMDSQKQAARGRPL